MGRLRKPPAAQRRLPAGGTAFALHIFLLSALVLLGGVAMRHFGLWSPSELLGAQSAVARTRLLDECADASGRLGAPSPTEADVSDACSAVSPLWRAPLGVDGEGEQLSCLDFLRQHWERSALVSRPGAHWSRQLMHLEDVASMIGSWPMRFFKNHGTANMQRPGSGFLVDERWRAGEIVPVDAVQVAMEEGRTLVMHNLEVYWPPIGRLVWHLVRYMHTYTQVNLYISPPHLSVATAPHQDAHSVFIVQTHGMKRWCVHEARAPWTLKALQRGKRGEILQPSDRDAMGPPVLNVTLRPGMVLYIPRGHFHHTATEPALLAADDIIGGVPVSPSPRVENAHRRGGNAADGATWSRAGEPSMALTLSVLSEDVFSTWLHLLGEALQDIAERRRATPTPGAAGEAAAVVASLRRMASRTVGVNEDAGARLREALPRALMAGCEVSDRPTFSSPDAAAWRRYATDLLADALGADAQRALRELPRWMSSHATDAPLFEALDAVMRRKRVPCNSKRSQIEAMQQALDGRLALDGQSLPEVDVDAIFKIEKRDKSYIPYDRTWFQPSLW